MKIDPAEMDPRAELSAGDQPATWHLDVRPILEDGGEPYATIMSCASQLLPGDVLVLHTLFKPEPMIRQLARMEFDLLVDHPGPDHWTVRVARNT